MSRVDRSSGPRRAPRMPFHSRENPVAFAGVVVFVANFLVGIPLGWGSLVANKIAYMVITGDFPRRNGRTRSEQWLGYMPVNLPWWSFAIVGVTAVALALLVTRPRWRFTPTDGRYFMYRTTPGFLTVTSLALAIALFSTAAAYNVEHSWLYTVGAGLAAVAAGITFVTWRWGAEDPPVRAGSHAGPMPQV